MSMTEIKLFLDDVLSHPLWRMVAIMAVALVAATALHLIVLPLLQRLTRRTKSDLDDHIFRRLKPALFQTIVLVGVYWALVDYWSQERAQYWIGGTLVTILVLVWGRVFLDVGGLVFHRLSRMADRFAWIQPQTLPLIQFGFKVVIISVQAYFILSAWHVNLTSWLASAGVAGIAVGFAAKDTLANFISGIFILADAPYKVGDYINIDDQTRGVVTDIGMRSTRLLTRDNIEVTLPNAVIGNAKVINESSGPSRAMRVRVNVSVAYGCDVETVREILLGCLKEVPYASRNANAAVRFMAMGESSLDFQLRLWVAEPENRGRVIDILNTRAYQALNEAGIEIPFPQRDLHVKSWPNEAPNEAPNAAPVPAPAPTDRS